MSRLTFEGNFCDIAMCAEMPCKYPDTGCSQKQTWERLKQYEDAEENGMLIRIPCKIGDEAYCIRHNWTRNRPRKGKIDDVFFDDKMNICAKVYGVGQGVVGKDVFLTSAEAWTEIEKREKERRDYRFGATT